MTRKRRNIYTILIICTLLIPVYTYTFYLIGDVNLFLLGACLIQALLILWFSHKYSLAKNESEKDALTQIYNRRFILKHFRRIKSRAKRKSQSLLVFYIDVDQFKYLNDHYGHHMGDQILQRTASILRRSFEHKHYVARWGGDEFIVLMYTNDTSRMKILQIYIADKLSALVSKALEIDVDYSVGCAVYSDKYDSFDDILHSADQNMYRHKKTKLQMVR